MRRQRYDVSTTIDIQKNYRLRLLYGPGYKRSISFGRWRHNRVVAKGFAREIAVKPIDELPDLIYACLPTLEVSEQAVLFGVRHSIPVVVDIRDQWPEIYLSLLPRFVRHFFRNTLLRSEFLRAYRILSQATAIIGVSSTNLEWGLRLAKRNAHPKDKWFPLGFPLKNNEQEVGTDIYTENIFTEWNIKKNCFVVTFVGSFSPTCNFKTVIDTARIFSQEGNDSVQFVLVGNGKQTSFLQAQSKRLNNIVLAGWCEKMQVDKILSVSSIGLMPYISKAPQTLPNKPFEYMAAGLPLLSSLNGELKNIIEQESIGLQYNADDPKDLKDKIMWFLSHPDETKAMGQRAKALFEKKYRFDIVYADLVKHLEKIASGRY